MDAEKEEYFKSFTIETISFDSMYDNVHVVHPTLSIQDKNLPRQMVKKYVSASTYNEANYIEECNKYSNFSVKLYYKYLNGDLVKQKSCYLLIEYCEKGSLSNYLSTKSLITTVFQFINLGKTFHIMHEHNLFHRDIKPDNIFITKGNIYKIGDFDVSRKTSLELTNTTTVKGTPNFLPKKYREILESQESLSPKTLAYIDIFAFGKTLIKCFIGNDYENFYLQGQDLLNKIEKNIIQNNVFNVDHINNHESLNRNIKEFSKFLIFLVNEDVNELTYNFGDVANWLKKWLVEFLKYQQDYFCYICSCSILGHDIIIPCSGNCNHCFHLECIKSYLDCDTQCNMCPLCDAEGDIKDIREFFISY
ncbi:hypothetical protein SteCoe_26336 [Stentor coeruleus]|uniref:Protein kinase domain-containing protein n=1 Tax=Stentor coeruleus TaxID=5963 RepID=A0A1R2BD54_9CILI|nr:hypothetical protein SteCoe_26336 [Stentor coeruleus]